MTSPYIFEISKQELHSAMGVALQVITVVGILLAVGMLTVTKTVTDSNLDVFDIQRPVAIQGPEVKLGLLSISAFTSYH